MKVGFYLWVYRIWTFWVLPISIFSLTVEVLSSNLNSEGKIASQLKPVTTEELFPNGFKPITIEELFPNESKSAFDPQAWVFQNNADKDVTGFGEKQAQSFSEFSAKTDLRNQTSKIDLFLFLFIVLLIFINYLLVIKNKFSYWITFLIIPFVIFSAINVFKFSSISFGLFGSFEEKSNFLGKFGIVALLVSWYLWTGVEKIFLSYKNIKPSGIGIKKISLGGLKMPNVLKNPLVISILILVIGAVSILIYYRYTDPYNQCLRAMKDIEPKSSEISRIKRCTLILKGK